MQLILGGARSGKSRLAEERAIAWAQSRAGARLVYIATAAPGDTEMAARINHHRARRSDQWQLVECVEHLAEAIAQQLVPGSCVLVDCLTLWISNCLHSRSGEQDTWAIEREKLVALVASIAQQRRDCELIMVSNEVGSGIVPLGELSRAFVDASGHLHQTLAGYCDQVSLVVAGLALELKTGRHPD